MIVRWAKNRWRTTTSAPISRSFRKRPATPTNNGANYNAANVNGAHNGDDLLEARAIRRYIALRSSLAHYPFVVPTLCALVCVVYLLMGSVIFLFVEQKSTESALHKYRFNQLLNRQQFAREVETMIFNDTQNILIIVDKSHSKRIHENLMRYLKAYEVRLFEMQNRRYAPFGPTSLSQSQTGEPHAEERWTLRSSLNYAWALLTTLGHATRQPHTIRGQFFAVCYSSFGVPFCMLTLIIIAKFLTQLIVKHTPNIRRNRALVSVSCVYAYLGWTLAFAAVISSNVISEDFWYSTFTAAFASLSIQSHYYNAFDESEKLLTLICTSISLLISAVITLLLFFTYGFCPCLCEFCATKRNSRAHSINDENIVKNDVKLSYSGVAPTKSTVAPATTKEAQAKLQLLVEKEHNPKKAKLVCASLSPNLIDDAPNDVP